MGSARSSIRSTRHSACTRKKTYFLFRLIARLQVQLEARIEPGQLPLLRRLPTSSYARLLIMQIL